MPAARALTTQAEVLERIVARLRDQIEAFNEATCFDTDYWDPPIHPPGDVYCTVSPGEGVFNAGGEEEPNSEAEYAFVVVSIFSRVAGDQAGHGEVVLRDEDRGLLSVWKLAVLKALSKYELTNEAGNPILRNLLYPVSADEPDELSRGLNVLRIKWATDFDWDLTP